MSFLSSLYFRLPYAMFSMQHQQMGMTIHDVISMRSQGRLEEAYEVVRTIYANNKSAETSSVMFWTAVDILKKRIIEGRHEEARKILLALERMHESVPGDVAEVRNALASCRWMVSQKRHQSQPLVLQAAHLQAGKWGENVAEEYLVAKGYGIIDRDWRYGHRDIDIIAQDANGLVFVEVKTRSDQSVADPTVALNHDKLKNLRIVINYYLKYNAITIPWRFDVITVVGTIGSKPDITHIQDFRLL